MTTESNTDFINGAAYRKWCVDQVASILTGNGLVARICNAADVPSYLGYHIPCESGANVTVVYWRVVIGLGPIAPVVGFVRISVGHCFFVDSNVECLKGIETLFPSLWAVSHPTLHAARRIIALLQRFSGES